MRGYKTPLDLAQQFGSMRTPMERAIHGAIRGFCTDHPEAGLDRQYATSLAKRISGNLKEPFIRLLMDRAILDWLEQHREEWADLSEIRGAVRHVIPVEMERRGVEMRK